MEYRITQRFKAIVGCIALWIYREAIDRALIRASVACLIVLAGSLLSYGPVASAQGIGYTPCANTGNVGGPGNPVPSGQFTVSVNGSSNNGAICDLPTLDASGNPADDYWLEVQDDTNQLLACTATLWIVDADGTEMSAYGGTNFSPGVTSKVVSVGPLENTTGIDVARTEPTLHCTANPAAGGGGSSSGASSGGGSGGSSGGTGSGGSSGAGISGSVSFVGSVDVGAINYVSDTVDVTVNEVYNSAGTISGPLEIELWFTSTPYPGSGGISGYEVAHFPLPSIDNCSTMNSQLPANHGCESINSGTISVTAPPAGTYFAALVIAESGLSGCSGYCIVGGVPLDNQETIPAAAVDPPTSGPSGGSSSGGGGAFGLPIVMILLALAVLRLIKASRVPSIREPGLRHYEEYAASRDESPLSSTGIGEPHTASKHPSKGDCSR